MTIDRTYPIFTVRWLAVHGLAVPTFLVGTLGGSRKKIAKKISFFKKKEGERRELNPRMVDSQSTALIHLATSAPTITSIFFYQRLNRSSEEELGQKLGYILVV